jgi:hypothetical protein
MQQGRDDGGRSGVNNGTSRLENKNHVDGLEWVGSVYVGTSERGLKVCCG